MPKTQKKQQIANNKPFLCSGSVLSHLHWTQAVKNCQQKSFALIIDFLFHSGVANYAYSMTLSIFAGVAAKTHSAKNAKPLKKRSKIPEKNYKQKQVALKANFRRNFQVSLKMAVYLSCVVWECCSFLFFITISLSIFSLTSCERF